jgi:hypothetical protein
MTAPVRITWTNPSDAAEGAIPIHLRDAQEKERGARAPAPAAHDTGRSPGAGPHPAHLVSRALAVPRALTPADVLHLQRTLGNRACGALLGRPAAGALQRTRGKNQRVQVDPKTARRREWERNANVRKRAQAIRLLDQALGTLEENPLFNARPLRRRLDRIDGYRSSERGDMENWNQTVGAYVQDVYAELVVAGENRAANKLQRQLGDELASYAELIYRPRRGQAQTTVAASADGSHNGRQYHDGSAGDRIPITFYKRPQHYADIQSTTGGQAIATTDVDPYVPAGLGLSPAVQFPAVNWPLDDMGRSLPRVMNVAVRKALVAHDFAVAGTEIDHIHDMGFGGADTLANLWPLDAAVNQRPNSGAWRSRYRFHYWDRGDGEIKQASINSPGMSGKHYVIKNFDGMEGNGRDDLPTENGQDFAGTWQTA